MYTINKHKDNTILDPISIKWPETLSHLSGKRLVSSPALFSMGVFKKKGTVLKETYIFSTLTHFTVFPCSSMNSQPPATPENDANFT